MVELDRAVQVLVVKMILYQVVPTDDDLLVLAGLPGHHEGLFVFMVAQHPAYSVGDVVWIPSESQFLLDRPSHLFSTDRLNALPAMYRDGRFPCLLRDSLKLAPVIFRSRSW